MKECSESVLKSVLSPLSEYWVGWSVVIVPVAVLGRSMTKASLSHIFQYCCTFPLCFHDPCTPLRQPHLTVRVRFVNTFTWRVVIVQQRSPLQRHSESILNECQLQSLHACCVCVLNGAGLWQLATCTFHDKMTRADWFLFSSTVIRCFYGLCSWGL